jgi:hypothetical protein
MAARGTRCRVWSIRAVLLAVVVLVTLVAACDPRSVPSCRPGLTVDEAQRIARDLALSGQPSDMIVVEISAALYKNQLHADTAWTVQVDVVGSFLQPSPPGDRVNVPMHWLIDVDKCTGGARVVGQG